MKRATIKLPQIFDVEAAQAVKFALLDAFSDGAAVTVDASVVGRVGTPGLQLLFSAAQTFSAGGHDILIHEPSEPLRTALTAAAITLAGCSNNETRLLNA